MVRVRTTGDAGDAYVGLDGASWAQWNDWHRAMLDEREAVRSRAGIDAGAYDDEATAWSDTTFRQFFLFLYDTSVYDRDAGRYRTTELVARWRAMFGRIDSVLLWHAYPRLGFDRRTQFDFYRQMPGGLERLRSQVCEVLRAEGIRVFVDYNPWDAGSYDELGAIVGALDADGVMLDTMTEAPERLASAVTAHRRGVVFAPELRPRDADLGRLRQSWAQWFDVGDASTPSIYRHRWIVPRHRQLAIRRWDTSRRGDIVYSFFNGSGLLLWDNIFGTWNPYSSGDRKLVAETGAILDRYQDLFVHGDWWPLVPTGVSGLDANQWRDASGSGRTIVTLRNRTAGPVRYRVPPAAAPGLTWTAFWGPREELRDGDTVEVEPYGLQTLVLDDPARARAAMDHFDRLSRSAASPAAGYEPRCPRPRRVTVAIPHDRRRAPGATTAGTSWIDLPGGEFDMTVMHDRRECGCTPDGASDDAMWGWFYKDTLTHRMRVVLRPFAIRATAVTNGEFLRFVHEAGYAPRDPAAFLEHLARLPNGALPQTLAPGLAALPVSYVSLDDARAFAAWHGERLPTEAEWQWAAEGAGVGQRYPWGEGERTFPAALRPALDRETATPQGVMGLSGNAWELTDSEHDDGHTRSLLLRGGVYLPPGESEWLPARGARPCNWHAKYLLLSDGLDRSETISFRTVVDGG
jgi:hypothetical protein